jgi:hypothetical protein
MAWAADSRRFRIYAATGVRLEAAWVIMSVQSSENTTAAAFIPGPIPRNSPDRWFTNVMHASTMPVSPIGSSFFTFYDRTTAAAG